METSNEERRGVALAFLAAIFLGTAVTVSRFAYNADASGIAIAGSRTLLITIVMAVIARYLGRSLKLDRKLMPFVLINGVLMAGMTYGNIGAVEFISIGLASLLFFTFPIIIAVIVMAAKIEPVHLGKIGAIGAAFVGIVLMLGGSITDIDWRGAAFALTGALCTAINAVLTARYFRNVDIMVVTMQVMAVAFVTLLIIALFFADVRFPTTNVGWAGLLGVATLQGAATPVYLYAVAVAGAMRAGMAGNIQPVVSIGEAYVVFDEVLRVVQAMGGGVVLLAVIAMQWIDFRRPRKTATAK